MLHCAIFELNAPISTLVSNARWQGVACPFGKLRMADLSVFTVELFR